MKKYFILEKKRLNDFLKVLSKTHKVAAPVDRGNGNFAFSEVSNGTEVALKYIPTILPPKKYFMPQNETIQRFDRKAKSWSPVVESEKTAIFGVHTCDLAGIQCLNKVFEADPKDVNYIARKNNIMVIGLECAVYCDEYASCAVMQNHLPNGGYDLFLTEIDKIFIVHAGTSVGEKIVKDSDLFSEAGDEQLKKLEKYRSDKEKIFKNEVKAKKDELKSIFDKSIDSKEWDEIEKRCLACGNCTNVCPTCYCFDIKDDINLDFNTGVRNRVWDSCQNEEFAKVAGGENFREKRGDRQKHRYMRKFSYPKSRFNEYFCTGCGRCSRTCMAEISLKDTINTLAGETK
jgi:sulfhydrogenase subunit beta (sulfur reductase)